MAIFDRPCISWHFAFAPSKCLQRQDPPTPRLWATDPRLDRDLPKLAKRRLGSILSHPGQSGGGGCKPAGTCRPPVGVYLKYEKDAFGWCKRQCQDRAEEHERAFALASPTQVFQQWKGRWRAKDRRCGNAHSTECTVPSRPRSLVSCATRNVPFVRFDVAVRDSGARCTERTSFFRAAECQSKHYKDHPSFPTTAVATPTPTLHLDPLVPPQCSCKASSSSWEPWCSWPSPLLLRPTTASGMPKRRPTSSSSSRTALVPPRRRLHAPTCRAPSTRRGT